MCTKAENQMKSNSKVRVFGVQGKNSAVKISVLGSRLLSLTHIITDRGLDEVNSDIICFVAGSSKRTKASIVFYDMDSIAFSSTFHVHPYKSCTVNPR